MAVNNSLTKKKEAQQIKLLDYLNSSVIKKKINEVVGGKNGQRFISSIVSATTNNPTLQECTNSSILSAALLGESLNLSPSPQLGHYYMVPFNNNKKGCKEAQFQLGYKGYIQLAIRSGQYKKLNVEAIKEGELISYNPFDEEIEVKLIEDPDERESAETIGYYAMFELTNGFKKAMYWSKNKMLNHADKYSQSFSIEATNGKYPKVSYEDFLNGKYNDKDSWLYSSHWYKNFDGMAFKTMLRQLISKWGIMSIDLQSAIEGDMAVIQEDGSKKYVENESFIEAEEFEVKEEVAKEDVENAFFGD